jgi:Ulp1 protease family, C-terminal catalytic domain
MRSSNSSAHMTKKNYKTHHRKTHKKMFVGGGDSFFSKLGSLFKSSDDVPDYGRMNCSPAVKGKTVDSATCYTANAAKKMKTTYNNTLASTTSHTKIVSEEPKQIMRELKKAFSDKCSKKKEDCLVNQMPHSVKEELDEELFAPDQPAEWKKNPNEWLSNFDIADVLEQYEKAYPHFQLLGPTSIDFNKKLSRSQKKCVDDDLCTFQLKHYLDKNKRDFGIIFNLSEHDEEGTHWVTLYIHIDDKATHNSFLFFFDSIGSKAPKEVLEFVKKVKEQGKNMGIPMRFIQNRKEHQYGDTECGMYSLYFIITMLTGEVSDTKHLSVDRRIQYFTKKRIPDKTIEKFRNKYFNS